MFGFGRKRVRAVAKRLGTAMFIIRDACRHRDLEVLANVMESYDFNRIEVTSDQGGPIAGWTEGPLEDADMIYFVRSYRDANGVDGFQVVAEGKRELAGLQLFADEGDVSVELSGAATAIGGVGIDAKTVRAELLEFPGFSSRDQLRERLGMTRRP